MKKITQSLRSVSASCLILLSLFIIIKASGDRHDAELNFSEVSSDIKVLGGIVPASCESGGNGLKGPDHLTSCGWTIFCSGATGTTPWEDWSRSNDETPDDVPLGTYCGPEVNVSFP